MTTELKDEKNINAITPDTEQKQDSNEDAPSAITEASPQSEQATESLDVSQVEAVGEHVAPELHPDVESAGVVAVNEHTDTPGEIASPTDALAPTTTDSGVIQFGNPKKAILDRKAAGNQNEPVSSGKRWNSLSTYVNALRTAFHKDTPNNAQQLPSSPTQPSNVVSIEKKPEVANTPLKAAV